MKKSEVLLYLKNFKKAVEKLREGVECAEDELDRDGVLQRFEFTAELMWKTLKAFLEFNGIECFSPRNCIKEALRANLIKDDDILLDIIEDRNKTSHIYSEEVSKEIFERVKEVYLDVFKDTINRIEKNL